MPRANATSIATLQFASALEDLDYLPSKPRARASLPKYSKIRAKSLPSIQSARDTRTFPISDPATSRLVEHGAVPPPANSRMLSGHSSSTRYYADLVRRRQLQRVAASKTQVNMISRPLPSSTGSVLLDDPKSNASLYSILIFLSMQLFVSMGSLVLAAAKIIFVCSSESPRSLSLGVQVPSRVCV